MAQITHGLRAILSHPLIYSTLQLLMGAHSFRKSFVANYVKPHTGMRILDIGCGPAGILAYLPQVSYSGFDISQDYIDQASKRFSPIGEFHCKHLSVGDLERLLPFDVVFALGLLHHLEDDEAIDVMQIAWRALKPGGRLFTIDPCWEPSQNPVARLLIRGDRGQNVRDKVGYEALAGAVFEAPRVYVKHRAWIPYTHCIMECQR
ncbi:class I SAM-dependent methyltransferase [Herbaspirillum sp. RTI4]|uniref:class I SAM-dependent methyltransferase n=1 Tax=Herbaspirillum sp. RTI4 TaxID=3048640 RepID=UPI002AB50157|nr:class I SAM-dependent methyltransferase [Herbaspirillum sp. RTI4]MDY7577581.1 class I SAM-dependent methyltransferase [Herbaspirillum sp. RTI4]MEA9981056.1 class I SAM-dependent methyltransferase [Herbaspirillum sp. RTI4]